MPTVPGTLAHRIRTRFPGAYDDLDDATLESKWDAKYPGAYDDLPRSTLPTKPVSAEDFAPRPRDVSIGKMLMQAATSVPRAAIETVRTLYSNQRPEDAFLGPAGVLAPLVRGMGAAHAAEAEQAQYAPTTAEQIGHGLAALLPVVGPAAAAAGEDIGSGDTERQERGGGDALAMLLASALGARTPSAARATGSGLATIGEQVAAKLVPLARKAAPVVSEAAKSGALELGAHAVGVPPGVVSAARFIKRAVDAGKKAAPEAVERAGPSPNAGGRLVRSDAPTVTQAIADALEEVRQETPPARISTPPEPQLPAGYTPRATVPKPKVAPKAEPAAEPATPPKRAYFLKSEAQIADERAARTAPTPKADIAISDLPASWQARVNQDLFPLTAEDAATVQAALVKELTDRGLSVGKAMMLISKNKDIPVQVRQQLLNSLNRVKGVQ